MIFRQTFHRLSSTLARRRAASSYIAAIDQGTSSTHTTFGTGAFTLMHTGSTAFPSENGLLSVKYALEGSVGSCAVGINWFQHKLDLFDSPQEMDS